MDNKKPDKTNNMVKMTIKRADDSTEDKNWVCKRIDDEQESATPVEMIREADESLTAQDENLNNEPEYAENWYNAIPSCLEIELKEGENQEQSRRNSMENNSNNSIIDCPASSHETIDNAATSISDPLDLSTSRSKLGGVTNVSNKSPPEAHTSQGQFQINLNAEGRKAPGLTGPVYHLPSSMWPQNIPPMAIQGQINPGDAYAMAATDMPFTSYNFPMNPLGVFPVNRGVVNTEKREIPIKGNISHMTQDEQRHQRINYKHFNSDMANYVHCSNEPYSNANQSYKSPLGLVGNVNAIPFRNVLPKRIGDNFVNTQPKNTKKFLKRGAENSSHLGSSVASKSISPPKKKKSHDVPDITKYCNACEKKFKTDLSYNNHLLTKKHLKNAEQIDPQQSNNPEQSNFKSNFEGGPSEQTNLQAQTLPPPHSLQLLQFQMWQHLLQAQGTTPCQLLDSAYQSSASIKPIDSNVMQNRGPETSRTNNNNEVSSSHLRSHNFVGKDIYPRNPRHMDLPFSPTCSSQGILLPPNPQSENSTMANSRNLENKAPNSSRAYKDISVQIQPEVLNVANYPHNPRHLNPPVSHTNNPQRVFLLSNSQSANSMISNSENLQSTAPHSSRAHKDNRVQIQPEGFAAANSSQRSGGVQSMTHPQENLFRIYHCMVCSIFKTNSWRELQLHIYADRSRTPLELVIPSGAGLVCKLCDFRSQLPSEMAQHCTSRYHLHRVSYYNHLREGGIFRIDDVFKNIHKSFWIFCAACEYAATSMDILHEHGVSQNHQYNVSCCMYIESFSSSIEYYACIPCNLKTLTKMELLIHARSREHKKVLEKYPCGGSTFHDPRHIFYNKELCEPRKTSEQNEVSTFIGREKKIEEGNIADNLSSVNLVSASSTSLQPQTVFCFLCQQVFPKIGLLKQHLQGQHGVNEAGVKWLISGFTKEDLSVHEVKSLPEKEITDTKIRKVKSTTFWPDNFSTEKEKLPIKRMSNNTSSTVVTEQHIAINENLNQRKNSDASSSQQFNESDNQNKNHRLNLCETSIVVCSSQELCKTDGMQNADIWDQNSRVSTRGRTSLDCSLSQEFHQTEGERNADNLNQNPSLNPHRMASLDGSLSQELHETEGRRNTDNLDQNPNLNSQERASIGPSSSQEFYGTEGISNPELHLERKINTDSTSRQQFCETNNILPAAEKKVKNSEEGLNSNYSRHEITVENDAESDDDGMCVLETDGNSSGRLSSTDTGSLISHSILNTSIESNGSWSINDISEPYERLPAIEKPISSAGRSKVIDSSSSQHGPLDSENLKSPLDCQPNLDLKRNEVNNSPINNLEASVGPKEKDNSILVLIENSDAPVNDQMELNDCPNESEVQFCSQNSLAETDPQIEAEKNIKNIEISGVFSLRGHIDYSSNTDDDDETADFDIYADL